MDRLIFTSCSNNKFWTSGSLRSLTDDQQTFLSSATLKIFLIVSLEILEIQKSVSDYSFVISFPKLF